MSNKRILWVTDDCFVDCDIDAIRNCSKKYLIHWITLHNQVSVRYPKETIRSLVSDTNVNTTYITVNCRLRNPLTLKQYLQIYHIYKEGNYDLIYFNVPPTSPYFVILWYLLPYKKTIITAHQGAVHAGFDHKTLYKIIRSLVYHRAKYINMFSESQMRLFSQKYKNNKIFLNHLGLKNYGKPTNQRTNDVIRFLSFGVINYTKNIDLLIQAGCMLYERGYRNFRIAIHGKCKGWEWYANQIKYPEIFETDIKLIDNDDIPNIFNESHYLVQPYRVVSQSGPMKIAFCYNVPVVDSDLPGFLDELKEGVNGFSFKTGDANALADKMEYLINNHAKLYPNLIKKMAEYTQEHYSVDVLTDNYLAMFDSVFKELVKIK